MRRLLKYILVIFVITSPVMAQSPKEDEAKNFIQSVINDGIELLSNDSLSEKSQEARFRVLLENNFAMKTIARFAIGKYWRQATPHQQEEYLSLFNDMIVYHYSAQFKDYKNTSKTVEITSTRLNGAGDVVVSSSVPRKNGQLVSVEWRVRESKNKWRVIDITVEGVSMAMTKRSEFSSIIQRNGGEFSALLTALRQSIEGSQEK